MREWIAPEMVQADCGHWVDRLSEVVWVCDQYDEPMALMCVTCRDIAEWEM